MTAICINNPYWYSERAVNHYLGARCSFVDRHCDYLFFSPVTFLRWVMSSDFQSVVSICRRKRILFSIEEINNKCDVFVTMNERSFEAMNFPSGITAYKINCLYDYNLNTQNLVDLAMTAGTNAFIGQGNHDVVCDYYKHYFGKLHLPLLNFPFGWNDQIQSRESVEKNVPFSALGAIAPVSERCSVDYPELEAYLNYFSDRPYSHMYRRWLYENQESLPSGYEVNLPDSVTTSRLTDIDEDQILRLSRSTFIDCGSLNFLPARFYEALDSRSIPITNIDLQVSDLEFDPADAFWLPKLNREQLIETVSHINENYPELASKYESYRARLSFTSVADALCSAIESHI